MFITKHNVFTLKEGDFITLILSSPYNRKKLSGKLIINTKGHGILCPIYVSATEGYVPFQAGEFINILNSTYINRVWLAPCKEFIIFNLSFKYESN